MRKLHPATIVVALLPRLKEAVSAAVPLIVGTYASGHGGGQEWIAVGIGSFTGVFAIGTYWTTRFDIEPDHVVHTSGWIFRKDRRIPLKQIQNVNIRQNVLERMLKVATIDVETAMGKGRDLKLSVLSLGDAERFREELLAATHLGVVGVDGLVVDESGAPRVDEPLVTLNRHDLLLGAVTENHIVQMIVGTVTIGGWGMGAIIRYASRLSGVAGAMAMVGGVMLLMVAMWLWGAASYYLKYGGFVVRRNENVFRISFGLLNKVQMAIRPSRIEYVLVTTTIPQRLMHRASLQVGTASSFGESGVLAPVALFVDRYRAYTGVADVIPGLDIRELRWRQFDPVFYRAAVTRRLIVVGVFSAIAFLASLGGVGGALFGWSLFGFVTMVSVLQLAGLMLARPENGFAITEDAVVVRTGYFHQRISAMPIERIENVAVTQPMWWRKWRAAQVVVQAMKHRVHLGVMPEAAVEELMDRWRKKMEARERWELAAATADEASLLAGVEVTVGAKDGAIGIPSSPRALDEQPL